MVPSTSSDGDVLLSIRSTELALTVPEVERSACTLTTDPIPTQELTTVEVHWLSGSKNWVVFELIAAVRLPRILEVTVMLLLETAVTWPVKSYVRKIAAGYSYRHRGRGGHHARLRHIDCECSVIDHHRVVVIEVQVDRLVFAERVIALGKV